MDVQAEGALAGLSHIFLKDRYPFEREVILERWRQELVEPAIQDSPPYAITNFCTSVQRYRSGAVVLPLCFMTLSSGSSGGRTPIPTKLSIGCGSSKRTTEHDDSTKSLVGYPRISEADQHLGLVLIYLNTGLIARAVSLAWSDWDTYPSSECMGQFGGHVPWAPSRPGWRCPRVPACWVPAPGAATRQGLRRGDPSAPPWRYSLGHNAGLRVVRSVAQ
jgi:hypothetical protein